MADRVLVWLLVERDGTVLLVRRKAEETPFAGLWVLPGEEMPEEESASETLERVAKEELGTGVLSEAFHGTLSIADGTREYSVNVFRVELTGQPRYRESGPYEEAAWAALADVAASGLAMPPQLLDALVAYGKGDRS